jgi:hypothetical protein
MNVTYTVEGSEFSTEVPSSDDLAELAQAIESHVRESHPELHDRPHLAERITGGLLDSLAAEAAEVSLGELT